MERESRTLEYKESVSKSFLKTVSAFANYGTGKIIFGISDSLETKEINNAFSNMSHSKPMPQPF